MEPEMTFEKAMERLNAITEQMETGSLPLEELAGLYKEGRALYRFCKEKLDGTEKELIVLAQEDADELQ